MVYTYRNIKHQAVNVERKKNIEYLSMGARKSLQHQVEVFRVWKKIEKTLKPCLYTTNQEGSSLLEIQYAFPI